MTNAEKALEALDSGDINWDMWLFEHSDIIRRALLRSHAIDEGFDAHEFASRVAEPDDYMRGYRECMKCLKGIGHDQ